MSEKIPQQENINPEWETVADIYLAKKNSIDQKKLIPFLLSLATFEKGMQEKYPEIDIRRVRLFHTLIGSTPMYDIGFDMLDLPGDEIKKLIDAQLE